MGVDIGESNMVNRNIKCGKNIEEYIQIYVKVSTDEAMKRDVKGNYVRFQKGEIEGG